MKDSSAYGAWNVQIVATGTGEALPGPTVCVFALSVGASCPITGQTGKWVSSWVGVGGGRSTA